MEKRTVPLTPEQVIDLRKQIQKKRHDAWVSNLLDLFRFRARSQFGFGRSLNIPWYDREVDINTSYYWHYEGDCKCQSVRYSFQTIHTYSECSYDHPEPEESEYEIYIRESEQCTLEWDELIRKS